MLVLLLGAIGLGRDMLRPTASGFVGVTLGPGHCALDAAGLRAQFRGTASIWRDRGPSIALVPCEALDGPPMSRSIHDLDRMLRVVVYQVADPTTCDGSRRVAIDLPHCVLERDGLVGVILHLGSHDAVVVFVSPRDPGALERFLARFGDHVSVSPASPRAGRPARDMSLGEVEIPAWRRPGSYPRSTPERFGMLLLGLAIALASVGILRWLRRP